VVAEKTVDSKEKLAANTKEKDNVPDFSKVVESDSESQKRALIDDAERENIHSYLVDLTNYMIAEVCRRAETASPSPAR